MLKVYGYLSYMSMTRNVYSLEKRFDISKQISTNCLYLTDFHSTLHKAQSNLHVRIKALSERQLIRMIKIPVQNFELLSSLRLVGSEIKL